MSEPVINNLRRQIEDSRPKGMQAGMPKASVYISDLEGLFTRYEAMKNSLATAERELKASKEPVCSVCTGDKEHAAKINCICGGIGTEWAELEGLRRELAELRREVEAAREPVPSIKFYDGSIERVIQFYHELDDAGLAGFSGYCIQENAVTIEEVSECLKNMIEIAEMFKDVPIPCGQTAWIGMEADISIAKDVLSQLQQDPTTPPEVNHEPGQ